MVERKFVLQASELPSLEQLLCSRAGFGLETASPLQRALCRISDGVSLGDVAAEPSVLAALGGAEAVMSWEASTGERPGHLVVVAGIRSGKTLVGACATWRGAWACDLAGAPSAGDIPRASFVSLTRDLGTAAYRHLGGALAGSDALRPWVVGPTTAGRVVLERPTDGRFVEAMVVAGSRAGASLAARWCAGAVLDEAPRMSGDESAVSYGDLLAVAQERLLPGAQVLSIGSPWAAQGPLYELAREHWGRPSRDVVVCRAPSPAMNPVYWTDARVEATRQRAIAAGSEELWRASVLAEWIDDAATQLVSARVLERQTRTAPAELTPRGWPAIAAIDPATKRNAWTLVVLVRDPERGLRQACARQWQGRDPGEVVPLLRAELARWGLREVLSDSWSGDALRALARTQGLELVPVTWNQREKVEAYDRLRLALLQGQLELAPDRHQRDDLARVRRRLTQAGITIDLPTTPDGRHCDYAPALALALSRAPLEAAAAPPRQPILGLEDIEPEDLPPDPLDRELGEHRDVRRRRLLASFQ